MLWQVYVQDEAAHEPKVLAFIHTIESLLNPELDTQPELRAAFDMWRRCMQLVNAMPSENALEDSQAMLEFLQGSCALSALFTHMASRLSEQTPDLAQSLVAYLP